MKKESPLGDSEQAGRELRKHVAEPIVHSARAMNWTCMSVFGLRTRVFDELITESIEEIGADAVLNLAASLDARAYRLPLPSSLDVSRGNGGGDRWRSVWGMVRHLKRGPNVHSEQTCACVGKLKGQSS